MTPYPATKTITFERLKPEQSPRWTVRDEAGNLLSYHAYQRDAVRSAAEIESRA